MQYADGFQNVIHSLFFHITEFFSGIGTSLGRPEHTEALVLVWPRRNPVKPFLTIQMNVYILYSIKLIRGLQSVFYRLMSTVISIYSFRANRHEVDCFLELSNIN